jgi:hypothetical protein
MYSNYYYILSAVAMPFTVFYNAVRPSIGNMYCNSDMVANYDWYKKITFFVQWISGWFSICLVCIYQPFIELWIGKNALLDFSTVVLLAVLFYEWRNFECMTVFKDAAGLWWQDRYRPYIAAIANLIVNIVLVQYIGINGVIISTILTRVVISWPWLSIVLFKNVFNIRPIQFFVGWLRKTVFIIVAGFITYGVANSIKIENIVMELLLKIILCLIFPNCMMFAVWHRIPEFQYCKKIVMKRIMKR